MSRGRRGESQEAQSKVEWLGQLLLSGPVVRVYDVVQKHVQRRLRRWLCSKHKVRGWEYARFPNEYLHDKLGLVQLGAKGRRLLWRKHELLSESRMREIRPSGSMSGRWKRGKACGTKPRRGNPDTRKCRRLIHRATSRLYLPLGDGRSRPAHVRGPGLLEALLQSEEGFGDFSTELHDENTSNCSTTQRPRTPLDEYRGFGSTLNPGHPSLVVSSFQSKNVPHGTWRLPCHHKDNWPCFGVLPCPSVAAWRLPCHQKGDWPGFVGKAPKSGF